MDFYSIFLFNLPTGPIFGPQLKSQIFHRPSQKQTPMFLSSFRKIPHENQSSKTTENTRNRHLKTLDHGIHNPKCRQLQHVFFTSPQSDDRQYPKKQTTQPAKKRKALNSPDRGKLRANSIIYDYTWNAQPHHRQNSTFHNRYPSTPLLSGTHTTLPKQDHHPRYSPN